MVMSAEQARKKAYARREAIEATYCVDATGRKGSMGHPSFDDPSSSGSVLSERLESTSNDRDNIGTKMEYA